MTVALETVSLEVLDGLKRQLTIEIAYAKVQEEENKRLEKAQKQAKLSGFRNSKKIPMRVIKRQFGKQIHMEAVTDLMYEGTFAAVESENLQPAEQPALRLLQDEADKSLKFAATFEVLPEINLHDLDNAAIEKETAEIQAADIDKVIEDLREKHKDWVDVEKDVPAAMGDLVHMDFEGFIDGEPFEHGKAEDYPIELGSNSLIPGFEEQLVGCKLDEEKTVELSFPEEYQAQNLAGKPASFKVKIRRVARSEKPELNDEFAKKFSIEGGMDALRESFKKDMNRELKEKLDNHFKEKVFTIFREKNPITVPAALIKKEIEHMRERLKQQLINAGLPEKQLPTLPDEHFAKGASKQVHLGLLCSHYIQEKQLTVDKDRFTAKLDEIASAYDSPEEVKSLYTSKKEYKENLESAVLEDQLLAALTEQLQVTEKVIDYQAAMDLKSVADEQDDDDTKAEKAVEVEQKTESE